MRKILHDPFYPLEDHNGYHEPQVVIREDLPNRVRGQLRLPTLFVGGDYAGQLFTPQWWWDRGAVTFLGKGYNAKNRYKQPYTLQRVYIPRMKGRRPGMFAEYMIYVADYLPHWHLDQGALQEIGEYLQIVDHWVVQIIHPFDISNDDLRENFKRVEETPDA